MEGPKLEDLRRRLIITEDREGNPQDEIYEIRNLIIEQLSHRPWFVGVAPFGSRIKGYAEKREVEGGLLVEPGSDYDFVIYLDSSKATNGGPEAEIAELRKMLEKKDFGELAVFDLDLNPLTDLVSQYLEPPDDNLVMIGLTQLFILADGPRVNQYREAIGVEISKRSLKDRSIIADNLVEEIVASEKEQADKIAQRLSLRAEDVQMAAEGKRAQWREWICDRMHITP